MSEKVYPQERTKHTPGPWKLYGFTQYGNTAWYVQDAYRHLTDEQLNGSLAGDQVDSANARLIAAAPELYEACTHERDTVSRLDWLSALLTEADANFSAWAGDDREAAYTALRESCELLSALRVAVAKAEGGTR